MAQLLGSQEYLSFRSHIPQKKICVDSNGTSTWTLYDAGPRSVRCPLVLLPPVSGRADVFFQQILTLSALGYRVIALDFPVYWNVKDFCNGLCSLFDQLQIDSAHLFGASLGGYLAQKFAEYTHTSSRVCSLILCNSFIDTTAFHRTGTAPSFWVMPTLVLKNLILGDLNANVNDAAIAESVDFVSEMLETLSQSELASRLTLNCCDGYVMAHKLQTLPVMIIDVNDQSALSETVKDEVCKCYPDARRAQLKSGGNFPYLSRPDEINLFLQIHLRQFTDTPRSATDSTTSAPLPSSDSAPLPSSNSTPLLT